MPVDQFPPTQRTWIDGCAERGDDGRAEVARHVMSIYHGPLQAYFLGFREARFRALGEPPDVVAGFFADRLGREEFFSNWQRSGLRLRRWLMTALRFYVREQARPSPGDRLGSLPEPDRLAGPGADPSGPVDSAYVQSIIQHAIQEAGQRCENAGLEGHWQMFLRHYVDGGRNVDIAAETGVAAPRVDVMIRTARRHFIAAVRQLLARDLICPTEQQIDDEIRALLEVIER